MIPKKVPKTVVGRPDTLPEPWTSLADFLGGAGKLYKKMSDITGVSETTAKRICHDRGAFLTVTQWIMIERLLAQYELKLDRGQKLSGKEKKS